MQQYLAGHFPSQSFVYYFLFGRRWNHWNSQKNCLKWNKIPWKNEKLRKWFALHDNYVCFRFFNQLKNRFDIWQMIVFRHLQSWQILSICVVG
jgi:hypothetical protein